MPHIHELYDYTTAVYIVYDSKVLMVNHPRYHKWIPVGGHIELDENPEEALYREIREETGLEVTILSEKPSFASPEIITFLPVPNYLDVHEANPPHRHISFTYFAKAKTDRFTISAEHADMQWLTKDQLKDAAYALTPAVQFYALAAISRAADNFRV